MKLFNQFGDMDVRAEILIEPSVLEKVINLENEIIRLYKNDECIYPFSERMKMGRYSGSCLFGL